MENEKQQQNEDKRHHHQEEDIQQHKKHQEEEEEQKQQQQHHQDEEKPQQKKQEEKHKQQEKVENEQNHAVSPFPLSKRSTSPRTIPKAQSPPFDHSPVDSQLSPDHSSLSYGFSDPPPISQPSDPNSMAPAVAVSRAEFTSRDQSTATTIEVEEQSQKLGYGSGKSSDLSILRRIKRDKRVKRALLGFRISGFVFCLVSFSVLAADKDQGWALDSFYRYKEFRFCMAVNVIGFVYSGFQAYDLAYQLTSGKQKPRSHLRCYLDFILDQWLRYQNSLATKSFVLLWLWELAWNFQDREMLAYLLISASSSAAVRVDDWQSNWGKDKFPEMARASMALSLVAFIALASSSLISGYTLCTFKSM